MDVQVVEDDVLIRMILVEDLLDAGYEVREASNEDEALAMIADLDPPLQVVVTGIHMPGQTNGVAPGKHVRTHLPHVPVIYTTSRPDALQATKLGDEQALIGKPYHTTDIIVLIQTMLLA